jgi:hypothetical protein
VANLVRGFVSVVRSLASSRVGSGMVEDKYKIVMPYLGGILSDNGYKFLNKATKPIVSIWKRELAEKAEALKVPEVEGYEIRLFGRFTDERRPDLSNLHKVIGDGLKKTNSWKGLGTDDKHFAFIDEGYNLGVLSPEIEIIIIPSVIKV